MITSSIQNPIESHNLYRLHPLLAGYHNSSEVDFCEEDYLRVSKYIGAVAPKFSLTDSKEPNSNNPEYWADAIVGHLGFPLHHAYYGPFFTNCNDDVLNGDKAEVITFPGKNDLINAYNIEPDENGNIPITFSAEDPKDGTYWMTVNAGEPSTIIQLTSQPILLPIFL